MDDTGQYGRYQPSHNVYDNRYQNTGPSNNSVTNLLESELKRRN